MRTLLIIFLFFSAASLHAANVTATTQISTNQTTATFYLNPPPAPLSCDSVNDSDLKGYWRLDEVSGDALDSKGSNNLTDHNAVTAETGKIGTSRNYTAATTQYHSRADNADLSVGAGVSATCAAWVRFGGTLSAGQFPGIMSKWTGGGSGQNEFALYLDGDTNRYTFDVTSDGGTETKVIANNHGAPTVNDWHYVVAWYDATLHTLNIQVDDGTANSISYSGDIFNGTSAFTVASIGSAFTWTGQIDEALFTKRVLTTLERRALYGLGRSCRPSGL